MKLASKMFALMMVAGLLTMLVAGPAAAAESGHGVVGNGTWDDTTSAASNANCGGKVTHTSATWNEVGTFTAASGAQMFTGATQATLTSNGAYYFDPVGSHSLNDCSDPAGSNVSASVDVATVTGVGTVTCTNLTGTFNRNFVSVVTVNVSGTCSVNGVNASVTVTWTLDVIGAPDPLGVGLPPSQIVGGDYSET